MPKQVVFSLIIEAFLVFITLLFLIQPRPVFRFQSVRARTAATFGGLILLCITFCWSVIFGCVLALNDLTFRL